MRNAYRRLYPLFAVADVLGTAFFAVFVNWWAPLFITSDGDLPQWLKWAATFDSKLADDGRDTYRKRVAWLYRNCAYGWSYWVLGVPFDPAEWRVVAFIGSDAGGDLYFYAEGPNGQFNEHYYTNDGKHIKRGWKAWNMYDAEACKWKPQPWGPTWRIPVVWSLSRK